MAYQEAMGADKAFAHGTGAGKSLVLGRRGKAFSTSCTYRPRRAKRCTQHVQCSLNCLCASLSLSLFGAPPQKDLEARPQKKSEGFRVLVRVIAIAEWLCVTRTAPHCDRGSLRMANQVATGAGKALAYSTGAGGRSHFGAGARLSRTAQAGGGSHLADQEASDAAKALAYGTVAGGRSHLAKLRDGARHCNR